MRLGRGFRALGHVHLQRFDHVIGAERLAVVEGHALAQVEGPGLGVGRGFPVVRPVRPPAIRQRPLRSGSRTPRPAALAIMKRSEWVRPSQLSEVLAPVETDPQPTAALGLCAQRQAGRGQNTGGGAGFEQSASANSIIYRSPWFCRSRRLAARSCHPFAYGCDPNPSCRRRHRRCYQLRVRPADSSASPGPSRAPRLSSRSV